MIAPDTLKNIRVVLCATSHPGNIGAAARAMKTMGLARLVLVAPHSYPDPAAVARASRATDVLTAAQVVRTLDEALADVAFAVACSARERDIAVPAADVRGAVPQLLEVAASRPVALVFGNETSGLSTEEVNKCDLRAVIPANPEYSSLNLAAAVQVFAYEVRQAAVTAPPPAQAASLQLANHEQLEGFYQDFESTLVTTGFLDPQQPKKLMPRLRRLFARARLEQEEVNILRGFLRFAREPRPRE